MSNSQFGARPGAQDMTTFVSDVGRHILNIGYMEVYDGMRVYGDI